MLERGIVLLSALGTNTIYILCKVDQVHFYDSQDGDGKYTPYSK